MYLVGLIFLVLGRGKGFALSTDAYYTSPFNQLKWLLYRSVKKMGRDPFYLAIKVGEAFALGLFLGGLFFDTPFDALVVVSEKRGKGGGG